MWGRYLDTQTGDYVYAYKDDRSVLLTTQSFDHILRHNYRVEQLHLKGSPLRTHVLDVPMPHSSKVICVALNYKEHVREFGATVPERPMIFSKFPSSLVPTRTQIRWSNNLTAQVDYEGELAVVIARTCRNVSAENALDYVLGYTPANDVTARDMQKSDGQWVRAKSLDTFCPIGPFIITPQELPDGPQNIEICTLLNGRQVQRSSTSNMIFSVAQIIEFCSRAFTLLPGDVILTGTPPGVGMGTGRFLAHGDKIAVQLTTPQGLTVTLENECRIDEEAL